MNNKIIDSFKRFIFDVIEKTKKITTKWWHNTLKTFRAIFGYFNGLERNKKWIICLSTTFSLLIIVLGVIFMCNTIKLSNAANSFIEKLEDGAFDEAALQINYSYYDNHFDNLTNNSSNISTTDISIISVIMENSDFSRSSISSLNNTAKFDLTIVAPDMYTTIIDYSELQYANPLTGAELTDILVEAASDTSTARITTTLSVVIAIENEQPIIYLDEVQFMDAVSGDLTRGYREIYLKALQEMIDYMGDVE